MAKNRPDESGPPAPEGGRKPEYIDPELIRDVLADLGYKSDEFRAQTEKLLTHESRSRRNNLDVIRRATYCKLGVEDIEREGGVGSVYNKVWYGPDDIRLYIDDIAAFKKKTNEGGVIFGFDEHPVDHQGNPFMDRGHPMLSVREQMIADLSQEPDANGIYKGGQYLGRYLADEQGNILAFATWTQPPNLPSPQRDLEANQHYVNLPYYKKMRRSLAHGVTGGRMAYARNVANPTAFNTYIPKMINFDTLIAVKQFAAARLFYEITEEMRQMDPQVEHFILYHLSGIQIMELLPDGALLAPRTEIFMPGENERSKAFFTKRGCRPMADESNPHGPHSRREIDGKSYLLNPAWRWYYGEFDLLMQQSQKNWEEIIASVGA